jgi:GT2 family glycosyltransferase/glycosyltransferase involved in cell wall biosynthesis
MESQPTITVLVVNLNGGELLSTCLDSITQQSYPAHLVKTIVVDNGSTDNSVELMREKHPSVQFICVGRNLGFAGGNNLGAFHANSDYLALINNDACAHPDWLQEMVHALQDQPETVCAASIMLTADGKTIDFVGSVMNVYGRAYHINDALPYKPENIPKSAELLAPCGGAMMIRRDVFLDSGGFDEDYIAYYEDIDLGWRLWLLGYRVILVPTSIVYHRNHKTGSRFPVEQRYALSEINALRTLIKNYDEVNLQKILPLSLFLGIKRAIHQAGMDIQSYEFGNPMNGDPYAGLFAQEPAMTRVAASYVAAMNHVADEMPRLLEKRERIQAKRVRTDVDIFSRFPMQPDNPLFPWREYQVAHDELTKTMQLPISLQPKRGTRLLIITHETIGPQMAGPGIRAWEMGCALAQEFDVTLAAPGTPARQHSRLHVVGYEPDGPTPASLERYISSSDVILAIGPLFAKLVALQNCSKPLVVDLYDPFEVEKLARSLTIDPQFHPQIDAESVLSLGFQSLIGDFFICASERQRDFWLGTLMAAGRINTLNYPRDPALRTFIDVVPFGVSSQPPIAQTHILKGVHPGIAASDKVLLWNGGLWDWFDPFTLVNALALALKTRTDIKLYFAAGQHFNPGIVPSMPIYAKTVQRCAELGLLDQHVFFGNWIPYDHRGDYLLEADLAVSIHPDSLESHLASRTRLLDCVWAGLPVLSTQGDPLSEQLSLAGFGRVVPPGRPDLLAQEILTMLADDGLRERSYKAANELRATLSWQEVVKPIAQFVRHAAFAPDALAASRKANHVRQASLTIQHQLEKLHEQDSALIHKEQEIATLQLKIAQTQQQAERLHNDNLLLLQKAESLEQEKARIEAQVSTLIEHLEAIRRGRVMRVMRSLNLLRGGSKKDNGSIE